MTDGTATTGVLIGGLAFLAGVFASIAAVFAIAKQGKKDEPLLQEDHYDGWEESLGV